MKRKIIKLAIIPALLIGIAAHMFFSNTTDTVDIVTAKSRINPGVKIESEMLDTVELPKTLVSKDAIKSEKDVVGKKFKTARVPGDFIFKDLISEGDLELRDDEMLLPIEIPQSLTELVTEGTSITVITLPTGDLPSQVVDDIPVVSIYHIDEAGGEKMYSVVKTTLDKAIILSPYLKDNSYQVVVN